MKIGEVVKVQWFDCKITCVGEKEVLFQGDASVFAAISLKLHADGYTIVCPPSEILGLLRYDTLTVGTLCVGSCKANVFKDFNKRAATISFLKEAPESVYCSEILRDCNSVGWDCILQIGDIC
jgi:hypothetical protein